MMRKFMGFAGAVIALAFVGSAGAAGIYTNNVPVAGQAPFTSTLPLTGNELVPADTQLPSGLNPQTEAIPTYQLGAYAVVPNIVTATNTAAFTATAAQVAPTTGGLNQVLLLTGTLAAGANITLPTAAAIFSALPTAQVGQSYMLTIVNESSGAFAWTVVAGTGDTITGSATVSQNSNRVYRVTFTSNAAATFQDAGT